MYELCMCLIFDAICLDQVFTITQLHSLGLIIVIKLACAIRNFNVVVCRINLKLEVYVVGAVTY